MTRVTNVNVLGNYGLEITFSDGMTGVIDLSPLITQGVFASLADPQEFARAFVDPVARTVAWPNGIDLCPDALYEDIQAQRAA